jgi:hypothetical protein
MRDRKSLQPEDVVSVRTISPRPEAALNKEIQGKIGQQLRAVYDDIVDQGVPDRFVELLKSLETEASTPEKVDEDSNE